MKTIKTPEEVAGMVYGTMKSYSRAKALQLMQEHTDQFRFAWKFCPTCGLEWDNGSDQFGCGSCGTFNHLQPLKENKP